MSGATANGWPYVQPADHPLDYPTLSQQLATKLESAIGGLTPIGGHMYLATNVPSAVGGTTQLAQNAAATLWGGVTITSNALVVPAAGLYRIALSGGYASNGSGTIRALWALLTTDATPANAGALGSVVPANGNTGGIGLAMTASGVWRLAAGDGVKAMARQDSGATLLFNGTLALQYLHA
jgi:hypothetical protein